VGKILPEKPFSILVRQEMMALAMASPFATICTSLRTDSQPCQHLTTQFLWAGAV